VTVSAGRTPGVTSAAVTFVTLGLSYGVWYSYSVFLVALLGEFGWSRSLVAAAFSVFVLVHGALGPALGWLADRIGPRRLVLAGGLVLGAGLWLDSAVARPWHLYVAFGVVTAAGVALAGWVPTVVLVQRWFPERVGTALGLTSAGVGVGIFLVVPLTQLLVTEFGWRIAFRCLGTAAVCWIVPVSLLVLKDPTPGPGSGRTGPAGGVPPLERPGLRRGDIILGEALRMGRFWLICAAQLLGSLASQMLLVHQVAYLVDHGIPALVAASVVSVVGLASIVGKTGGGWLSDRLGREITYTVGMASVAASVGMLGVIALGPGSLPAYAYGALVGVGYAVTAPILPALLSDTFRGRHFGAIFGVAQVANSLGGALGPWLGGHVFDATGSYAWAFMGAVLSAVAAATALWTARSLRPGAR